MSDTDTIYKHIASRIRELRSSQGLALEELAFRAGIAASYLGQIERLERKPSIKTLHALSHALRVSPGIVLDHSAKANGKAVARSNGLGKSDAWNSQVTALTSGIKPEQRKLILNTLRFICRQVRSAAANGNRR